MDEKLYSPESDSTTGPDPQLQAGPRTGPDPQLQAGPRTEVGPDSKKNSVERERKTGSFAIADAYKVSQSKYLYYRCNY